VNTSYNPQHYQDDKIPLSEMLGHLLMFYKYGGKQLYYFQTYDGQGELNVTKLISEDVVALPPIDEADCESCTI